MQEWQEQSVRIGDRVRDRAGKRGEGRVVRILPKIGCDIEFPSGISFLGFGWIEKGSASLDDIPVDF